MGSNRPQDMDNSAEENRQSGKELRLLVVEDSAKDAELVQRQLTKAGYQVSMRRVAQAPEMREALGNDWDLIIADYQVPGFGALPALRLLKQSGRDIPFIILSGMISDEIAVAAMRAGAHDYVLKGNLARLLPAIEREVQEAVARRQMLHTEAALRQADEAIHVSEARLQGIIGSAMDAIISVDEQQRIVVFNRAAEKMFLCTAAEAHGSSLDRFIPANFRGSHRDHIPRFGVAGATTRSMYSPGVLTALRSNAEEFPIEATISQVEAAGQKLYTVILRDITERKRIEEQLHQAQKLEAIGRLAGGVAHDFNTLLNIMLGYAELLHGELPAGDPRRERVEQIENAAQMSALLTKQLLAFSRKQAIALQVLDLNKAVADVEPMLRRLLPGDIELEVHYSGEICPVKVNLGQIQQVVLNLATNARDAMPRGGNLTIEVRTVELDEAYVRQHPSVTPGRYGMLAVSDTGTGMDAETAAHLFEPFFTTKATGKGTGLGLSTVYGIAKQSAGDIWVYSEPGVGSIFKVYLPRSSEAVETRAPIHRSPQKLTGNETILLVEDSKPLRQLTREILSREGYAILEAADGLEALELFNNHNGRIHLLMTDIVMPKMRGTEVAAQVIQLRPDIAVVYLSGYTEEAMAHLHAGGRITILEKPYTAEALLRTVRQALDDTQILA
jgi:two-component system cell cycle sensor histidine kinase/response regulator CckA